MAMVNEGLPRQIGEDVLYQDSIIKMKIQSPITSLFEWVSCVFTVDIDHGQFVFTALNYDDESAHDGPHIPCDNIQSIDEISSMRFHVQTKDMGVYEFLVNDENELEMWVHFLRHELTAVKNAYKKKKQKSRTRKNTYATYNADGDSVAEIKGPLMDIKAEEELFRVPTSPRNLPSVDEIEQRCKSLKQKFSNIMNEIHEDAITAGIAEKEDVSSILAKDDKKNQRNFNEKESLKPVSREKSTNPSKSIEENQNGRDGGRSDHNVEIDHQNVTGREQGRGEWKSLLLSEELEQKIRLSEDLKSTVAAPPLQPQPQQNVTDFYPHFPVSYPPLWMNNFHSTRYYPEDFRIPGLVEEHHAITKPEKKVKIKLRGRKKKNKSTVQACRCNGISSSSGNTESIRRKVAKKKTRLAIKKETANKARAQTGKASGSNSSSNEKKTKRVGAGESQQLPTAKNSNHVTNCHSEDERSVSSVRLLEKYKQLYLAFTQTQNHLDEVEMQKTADHEELIKLRTEKDDEASTQLDLLGRLEEALVQSQKERTVSRKRESKLGLRNVELMDENKLLQVQVEKLKRKLDDLSSLNENLVREKEDNRVKIDTLHDEIIILKEERKILENQHKLWVEEKKDMHDKIDKMDKLVYGSFK